MWVKSKHSYHVPLGRLGDLSQIMLTFYHDSDSIVASEATWCQMVSDCASVCRLCEFCRSSHNTNFNIYLVIAAVM